MNPEIPQTLASPDPGADSAGSVPFEIPLHFKTEGSPLPRDECAYLLTGDGLFLSRNHRFFESCVPAPAGGGPAALARQRPFLRPRFPPIPRRLFRQILAFARALWRREGAEVIVFFTVTADGVVDLLVPEQTAVVQLWRGDPPLPVRLRYELPVPEAGTVIFGDIHSHGGEAAYSSWMDQADEQALTGLHLVVGRLDRVTPEFHVEATIDGFRFSLPSVESVLGPDGEAESGPEVRLAGAGPGCPEAWLHRVRVQQLAPRQDGYGNGGRASLEAMEAGEEPDYG